MISFTIDSLIKKRKELWNKKHSIELDTEYREAAAKYIVEHVELVKELRQKPERCIELFFVVVDKKQKTTPFFLNKVQLIFCEKLNKAKLDFELGLINEISILILKGRQQGFTTVISAYQYACSILNKNFKGMTLADSLENTEAIFENKVKYIHDSLPAILKPSEKFNNKRSLFFDKLNSSWTVATATDEVGRSKTINFLHASEAAFWKIPITKIQAGLGEALTANCVKIYESTANGFNDFKKMWDSKHHINLFFEWWQNDEYRISFVDDEAERKLLKEIHTNKQWIYQRLKWLLEVKKLDLEQLNWYLNKYNGYIDPNIIKQEYPCTPDEAFLASGRCFFNKEEIILEVDRIKDKKYINGYFTYDYDGLKISNIEFKQDTKNGYIRIHTLPKKGYHYALGGDTAGEGSDAFTGIITNGVTQEIDAVLENSFNDEAEYVRQMYCLGLFYNTALVGIEINFSTYPNRELLRLDYPNIFYRKKVEESEIKEDRKIGFETNKKTRPLILGDLKEVFAHNIEDIKDVNILNEAMVFIYNKNGRPEAMEGKHDDLIMGTAIAFFVLKNVKKVIDKEKEKEVPDPFHILKKKGRISKEVI